MKPNIRIAPIDGWGTLQVTTAATGTNYTALPDKPARVVTLRNATASDIDIRKVGSGESPYLIPPGEIELFVVVSNANEIELKRTDNSNTQLTLAARYEN
jgi:hypothetical protein